MRKEIIDGIIKDMIESNGARPSDIILKGVFSKKTDKYGFEFRWRIDKTLLADKELSTMDCLHYTKNVQDFIDSIAKDFEANSTVKTTPELATCIKRATFGELQLTALGFPVRA